jgi:hypothetical protein
MRPNEFMLYYVAITKADCICSLESGPYLSYDLAEAAASNTEKPGGACRLTIVGHEIIVNEVM